MRMLLSSYGTTLTTMCSKVKLCNSLSQKGETLESMNLDYCLWVGFKSSGRFEGIKIQMMIIQVLLNELIKTRKTLKTVIGISEEKTVQHYLKSLDRDLEEMILATEKTLEESI